MLAKLQALQPRCQESINRAFFIIQATPPLHSTPALIIFPCISLQSLILIVALPVEMSLVRKCLAIIIDVMIIYGRCVVAIYRAASFDYFRNRLIETNNRS